MENLNTIFARQLLKQVMVDVRKELKENNIPCKEFISNAWGYKYSGGCVEFHINKNEWLGKSYYWHGRGSSVTEAKANGWSAWLESKRRHDREEEVKYQAEVDNVEDRVNDYE